MYFWCVNTSNGVSSNPVASLSSRSRSAVLTSAPPAIRLRTTRPPGELSRPAGRPPGLQVADPAAAGGAADLRAVAAGPLEAGHLLGEVEAAAVDPAAHHDPEDRVTVRCCAARRGAAHGVETVQPRVV